jgi:translation initiation factor 1
MSNKNKNKEGIVYSTNPDFQYNSSQDDEQETLSPEKQRLYVRKEMRNGKPTIVVKEFIGTANDLKDLEKQLKQYCGVGGSSKEGDILIQGDVADKVKKFLQSKGYQTKG